MTQSESFKLTRKALSLLCIKRDAASVSLKRLEDAGLIKIQRKVGQRPTIFVILTQEIESNLSQATRPDMSG
jgi:DNA-binding MarR family transcriptional regulator